MRHLYTSYGVEVLIIPQDCHYFVSLQKVGSTYYFPFACCGMLSLEFWKPKEKCH